MTEEKKKKQSERQRAWRKANPDRAREHYRKYREKNKDLANARTREWRARNSETQRLAKRRWNLSRFGLTVEEFESILARQGGVCAICKMPETRQRSGVLTLSVDHCHSTGRVRGLLCNRCNRAIGLLRDDAQLCEAASRYLK